MNVAIFPGHVGKDSGAVDQAAPESGDNLHTVEAVVTYTIALLTCEMLSRMGIDNVLAYGGWDYRIAQTGGCTCGVSIHADTCSSPAVHGYHVMHYPGSKSGETLSRCIDEQMLLITDRARQVHPENLKILRDTTFPCALLEVGFLSNVSEEAVLMQSRYQHQIAHAIVSGLIKWQNSISSFS